MLMPDGYALCNWLERQPDHPRHPRRFPDRLKAAKEEAYALERRGRLHPQAALPVLVARVRNHLLSQARRALQSQNRGLEKLDR